MSSSRILFFDFTVYETDICGSTVIDFIDRVALVKLHEIMIIGINDDT